MCDLLVYVLSVPLCYSNCYYTKSVLLIMLNKIQFNSKKKRTKKHVAVIEIFRVAFEAVFVVFGSGFRHGYSARRRH